MDKTRKAMLAFIEDIPNSKLEGGIGGSTIYTDNRNFRLDNHGTTTAKDGKPAMLNIQMQINNRPKMTSPADVAPSVARIAIPVMASCSAEKIKAELEKSLIEHDEKTRQY
ncbi:hypothetical protein HBI56_134710 [Parastagonospora nodorum]|uniref:Uncharacterized protein n=2 Tax=Phaeosphaeria nodorum (strain SN15 / ATCC MYA-4574 / FGSC 10173) TaxID=321614 RepID=A0A7U2I321_PHANO|nr:hypothetical protein SNOG_06839 [Parastagonospora nodorum SN15]KAH3918531.1 hypothetical protein HBH56_037810 [Parastagonospora nodorum]EAT85490.1 hypothetical protein SNOG_06839 [Parastagonospora nodorum SN15]KAH3933923.1 hypothetical protein HBH54_061650 [Parastagonospora nodorum]KAH3952593.1 hypothetical protein HBH53_048460 [Parastagonospora nodorum]KAH3979584.1 hypothetical protein HBH51_059460 [Parastagonospora nodorum]